MDKQPVGQLPDLQQSNNDDEIMVITNSEYNQLKKEKISDLITDFTSTNENNALTKGTDGKMFVTDFGNASNITEGTLPVSVLPDIPKDKLPEIETDDLPDSGITAGTYTYPTDIVVNSKGQVTSITEGQAGANNANQDLSNLGPLGLDKLNQSKALETGSVSSDADVYADVLKYAHSTFDKSKFTVVGSPTITDDGIASGFSVENYISSNRTFNMATAKDFELHTRFKTPESFGNMCIIHSLGAGVYLSIQNNGILRFNDDTVGVATPNRLEAVVNENTWYDVICGYTADNVFYLKYKKTDEIDFDTKSQIMSDRKFIDNIYLFTGLFVDKKNYPFNDEVDLSQLSITVDGVEVFNGNKTGLDVVKPDDYTVVGTPVISDDGIASGFSNQNYFKTIQISQLKGKSWEIHGKWINKGITVPNNSNAFFDFGGWIAWGGIFFSFSTKTITFHKRTGVNGDPNNEDVSIAKKFDNIPSYIQFIYGFNIKTGNYYAKIEYGEGWEDLGTSTAITENKELYHINEAPQNYIRIGTGSDNSYNKNAFDIYSFKVYIEGDLAYQTGLKIPYTLSKTGSKIVDAAYRDRVQDMYEQYGVAMYYTLDKENENFTLPMGEIYGMIAQNKTFDGFSLFDTKLTDRILTGDEAVGWALQGSLVTMTYPDAVNRIKEEYAEGTVAYIKQNLPLPEFTSNTTNGITVSDSGGHDDAYSLINGVSTMYTTGPWSSYWFNIDYDEQTYIKTYSLKADNSGEVEYPSAWTLQANNGGDTDWVTLDTQTAQTFTKNQQKTYPVNSETSYRQYRIVFSDGEETSRGNGELSQISFDVDNILFEYKTAVNGHLIADISQKTAIDTLYSETGIADFYILDSTNNQFYLPRNKYFMQLTDSTALLNSYNEPGLPNIKTEYEHGMCRVAINNHSEILPPLVSVGTSNSAGSGGVPLHMVNLDISTINSVYGNSETVQPPSSNKLLYYKVGHTVTNSGSIDVANVLSDINLLEANKADKDLSNCTKPYVTETYKNGASWYRVWSDGWCEQGGLLPSASSAQKVTVTFLKTFSNTNYNIFKNVAANNSDGVSYRVVSFYDKQLSQADTYATAGGSGIATWEAHGFI